MAKPVSVEDVISPGRKKKGKKKGRKPAAGALKCPKCDASVKSGMKFCNRCGTVMGASEAKEGSSGDESSNEQKEVRTTRNEGVFHVVAKEPEEEIIVEEEVVEVEQPVAAKEGTLLNNSENEEDEVVEEVIEEEIVEEVIEEVVEEEYEEELEELTPSAQPRRTEMRELANTPVRLIDSSKFESEEEDSAEKGEDDAGMESMNTTAATKEMQDMARFFEKHRLTRERLESSANLLLDKLKMLKTQTSKEESGGSMIAIPMNNDNNNNNNNSHNGLRYNAKDIDESEWEDYDIRDPMFPFIALAKEARNLYLPRTIDVLDQPPDPLTFYREYVASNIPCVFRNATQNWKASAKTWNNQYLRKTMADSVVTVECTPKGKGDYIRKGKFVMPEQRKMKFSEFMDTIEGGKPRPKGNLYISHQNGNFLSEFKALSKDVEPHLGWATEAFGCLPEVTNIWMGDSKAFSSCHKDHYENIYVVVTGEKHFTLLPPTDYPFLYEKVYPCARFKQEPTSGKWKSHDLPSSKPVPWVSVDPDNPDLNEFPMFAHCSPIRVTVKAGQCLYLPSLWYHQVSQTADSEGKCIAINYWYDMRYDIKFNYRNFLANASKCFETPKKP